MSPTFAALRVRNYRWYVSGQLVNTTGTWMQRVAQDWLVLELSGSSVALGITTALQFLPFLVLAPLTGVLADRFSRRWLLVLSGIVTGAAAVALGAAVATGTATVGLVYVLAFVLGVAAAVDNPARQAMVGEMVGQEHLTNAVALNSASFNLARIGGPSLAGVVIAAWGTAPVFWLNAVTCGFSILALLMLRSSEFDASQGRGAQRATFREGWTYLRHRFDLVFVLVLAFVVATFGLNYQLNTALMAREGFEVGAAGFGLMGTVLAVGSLVGSLRAARRGRPRLRLVVAAALLFSTITMLCGLAPTYPLFLLLLPAAGATAMTFTTAAQSYLQLGTEPHVRGRVMGFYTLVFFGGTPLGAPAIGWVAEVLGPRWGLIGGGLLALLGVALATVWAMRHDGLRARAHLRPRPHLHLDETRSATSAAVAG